MKKLMIWFVLVAVLSVAPLAQASFSETIPLDKLPPDVQLKDIITEYPLKIGTVNDKAIIRVVNKELIYKNKINNTLALEQIEIILNGKSIYQDKSNQLFVILDKNSDTYFVSSNRGDFSKYALIKGSTKDYFLYYIEEPGNPEGIPDYYTVISIETNNQKNKVTTLKGEVLLSGRYGFSNPKIDEHTYKLVEDKYIVSTFYSHVFGVVAYYEIVDGSVKLADKEFGVNLEDNQIPDKDKMKEVGLITLYSKPDINSTSRSVKLSEKTQIKLLGIKYITSRDMDSMTHIMIDNEEGWIDYRSLLNNFGFSVSF